MRAITFALSILPGKQEAWRRCLQEVLDVYRSDYEAFRRQLPSFRPKCPPFDFSLKRPGTAVAETRAETPGTHRVLWDVAVVSGRVPLPPCLTV